MPAKISGQRAQRPSQEIGIAGEEALDGCVLAFPYGNCGKQQSAPGRRERKTAAALVGGIDLDLHEPAPHKRFEIRSQRGAIHGQQIGDARDSGRLRPIERHQQRKLPAGKVERPQRFVEAPRQSASRSLHVQTKARVTHVQCEIEWRCIAL